MVPGKSTCIRTWFLHFLLCLANGFTYSTSLANGFYLSSKWFLVFSKWALPLQFLVSSFLQKWQVKRPTHATVYIVSIYKLSKEILEVKLPTIWTDEKQSREEAERRERSEERRVEEKESEESRCRCAKR